MPLLHTGRRLITTKHQLVVVVVMIGSLISSIKSAKSFSSFSRLSSDFGNAGFHKRSLSSGIIARFAMEGNKGNMFNEYTQQTKKNATSLLIPSMAAMSTLTVAASLINEKSNNSTQCQPNNDHNKYDNAQPNQAFPEELLFHDTYNGVTVDLSKFPKDNSYISPNNVEPFLSTLIDSLQQWKENGKRGIWIHIPTEYSMVIPKCIELGFDFQFAKNGLLVLTKWLPHDQESKLPHGPTHQIGVGVIIIHPITKKMLVVQEKTGPAAGKMKMY